MQPNVLLPLLSSLLSFVFALFLLDQWLERRRSYQLIWTIGMIWYGLSAGTEFLGGAFGWSEGLYRAWYLIGAVYVAAWLGLGTMFLLGKTRFGYGAAFSVLLAGLFTVLSQAKAQYPDTGVIPYAAFAIAAVGAILISIETYRGTGRWAIIAGALIIGGSAAAIPIVLLAAIPAPGLRPRRRRHSGRHRDARLGPAADPAVQRDGRLRAGPGCPVQHLRVHAQAAPDPVRPRPRSWSSGQFLLNLLIAPFAIMINLLVSVPGTVGALFSGKLHSRVPATILLAIGGFIPSITSGLSRFGITETFFLGEFLGVVFLFAGTLVSVEVFREFRIPFTRRVFRIRHEAA